MLMAKLKYFTSTVFIISISGLLLIIIGETQWLHHLLPKYIEANSPVNSIIRSIGAAFVGSGVFTAIIKSSEYTSIFSKVISEIIWSKKYIDQRTDKRKIWSMVSKSMYEEKFSAISDDIEEIIVDQYFPTNHNFYLEDEEFTMNISSIANNEHFWIQEETFKVKLKPTNANETIKYKIGGDIDLPDDPNIEDITNYTVDLITIDNEAVTNENNPPIVIDKRMKHFIELNLKGKEEYNLMYKRTKIVCKKTNPDKRFFSLYSLHFQIIFHKICFLFGGFERISGDCYVTHFAERFSLFFAVKMHVNTFYGKTFFQAFVMNIAYKIRFSQKVQHHGWRFQTGASEWKIHNSAQVLLKL